jgi:hypothetical protein
MDEADDGVSDPVPFDAAFDSMVDLQRLDIDGMLRAFSCHPMQSSMNDWSSLEEDHESLFDNNGFLVYFLMLRRRVPGKTTLPMLRLKYSGAKKSSCLCL